VPPDEAAFDIHPGLVDSWFQGPVAFAVDGGAAEGPTLAIPFAAARIGVLGRPPAGAPLFGHVRARESRPLPNGRTDVEVADLHLFTADGTSVLVAERFRVRRAPRAALEPGRRAGSPHAYELTWVPWTEPPAPDGAGRAVLLAGDGAGGLREALEAAGHRVRAAAEPAATEAGHVDVVVDARFARPGRTASAADALAAAIRLATDLRRMPRRLPYAVVADGGAAAAPVREALWGLLASLEAEDPERRLLRVAAGEGGTPRDVARVLAAALATGVTETRLAVAGPEARVARLARVTAAASPPAWTGGALVTGGLGALGLSVARALARQGAPAVTLMGRSEPDATARQVIGELAAAGVRVTVVTGDVTDPPACARAVAAAGEHAPLRAVLHLAGTIDDRAFERLDAEAFARVFAAKALGAETLAAALDGVRLDALVLFSSVAAVLGSPGQANYAAANGCLAGLALALRARGVPASCVSWGPWIPADRPGLAGSAGHAARRGVRPLTDEEAAPLLELALDPARSALVAVAADFDRHAAELTGSPGAALVSGLAAAPASAARPGAPRPRGGWLLAELRGRPDPERALQDAILRQVLEVLGEDEVDRESEFADMGLDSIMAIDLRNRLAGALDVELPATAALDHPTIPALARHLAASALAREPAETAGGR
jgi:NAD(P)-dependent dehydrogenase (short-subunit alcohol dehydrogenase family)/acyl carrier protein